LEIDRKKEEARIKALENKKKDLERKEQRDYGKYNVK
jgi:hypothetical protein